MAFIRVCLAWNAVTNFKKKDFIDIMMYTKGISNIHPSFWTHGKSLSLLRASNAYMFMVLSNTISMNQRLVHVSVKYTPCKCNLTESWLELSCVQPDQCAY